MTIAAIRSFVTDFVVSRSVTDGQQIPVELSDQSDLLLSGLLDSLGFADLIASISEQFGQEVDLEDLDAEQMTVVGPLCRYLSEKLMYDGAAPEPTENHLSNSARRH